MKTKTIAIGLVLGFVVVLILQFTLDDGEMIVSQEPQISAGKKLCVDAIEILELREEDEEIRQEVCGERCTQEAESLFSDLNYRDEVPESLYDKVSSLRVKYSLLNDKAQMTDKDDTEEYSASSVLIDVRLICNEVSA